MKLSRLDRRIPEHLITGSISWVSRISRISRISLAIAIIALFSGCDSRTNWLSFRGKQGRGYTSTNIGPPIAVKWKLQLQYDDDRATSFNPPIIYDDTIYFGSSDGNFYALDIESGYMRWVFKTEGPINSVPTADEDNIYFGSNDGFFYCVSREDGHELWSFDTNRQVRSSTVRYEDSVVFTSDIGATYLFDVDGNEQFNIENYVWLLHTFQIYEDVMYFAPGPESNPRSLGAFDINTRSYLWWHDSENDNATWYSFPALKGDSLYYSTASVPLDGFDLAYYGFDRHTGEQLWSHFDTTDLGNRVSIAPFELFRKNLFLLDYLAPSLFRDLVIYTSGDRTVRAFEQRNGSIAWTNVFEYPTSSAPTVAGSRVYFGVHGDNLSGSEVALFPGSTPPRMVALSARNGKLVWSIDIEGSILSAPVISGKWIVFGTDENVFYVLEEAL